MITSRRRLTVPTPIVTIEEMRDHLRLDVYGSPLANDEDALVMIKVQAATDEIDAGRDCTGWLGRALGVQQWRITARSFPGSCANNPDAVLWLPLPPLVSVDSVRYRNTGGEWVELAEGVGYELRDGDPHGGIAPLFNATWPVTGNADNAVEVTFTCGYDADASPANPLPALVKQFVMVCAGTMFEQREDLAMNVNTKPVEQFRNALKTLQVFGP